MPVDKESLYPLEWLKKGAGDFKRVSARLEEGDLEDAAFHLQQALEKYIKGFLLFHGWKLKKIHDLEALLDDAVKYDPGLESFRHLVQRVTSYYLIDRYPTFEELPPEDDVLLDYHQAKPFVQLIRNKIMKRKRKR